VGAVFLPLLLALWAFLWFKIGSLGGFLRFAEEQGVVLSSEKRRDPLACIDPPLTVRLAFSEGQKQGEMSFREGKTPSPRRLSASAPLPRPLLPRKGAEFDTV